jgi:hypothetical protein
LLGIPAMKAVSEMKDTVAGAEHVNRGERDAVAHGLGVISNDVWRSSGCPLLDGRIDGDCCERDALDRPLHFAFADRIHGGSCRACCRRRR